MILWVVLQVYREPESVLRVIRFLFNQNKSCIRFLDTSSNLFPVHVGQGLSLVTDSVCDLQDLEASLGRGGHLGFFLWIMRLSFDLQCVLERLMAECEATGIIVSFSKSEIMVLN